MKSFRVDYTPDAQKIIDKLENSIRNRVLNWIKKILTVAKILAGKVKR